jgi:hypothetical protein
MLRKRTRADLIQAHGALCEQVMDSFAVEWVYGYTEATQIRERAAALDAIVAAVSDYAMIVVDDTFAHLGFTSIYARNYVGAIREASEALNRLLMAHAAKVGERGQPDPAA